MSSTLTDDYKGDIKPDHTVPYFSDSISSIAWAPATNQHLFATTAWDGELRVFSVQKRQVTPLIFQKFTTKFDSPALKCVWNDQSNQIYVGLANGSIRVYDFGSGQEAQVGRHDKPINFLYYDTTINGILSSAYESTAYVWKQGSPNPVLTINAQNKIFASDFKFPHFIAGTANEKILMMDINFPQNRSITDSSDLGKYSQIQSIAINHSSTSFGLASQDGRANISTIFRNAQGTISQKSVITFKSNKQQQAGNTILYPINSVEFNPQNEKWLMTAGADGCMHFWDYEAKNKIKTLSYSGNPICTAKVNPTGEMVAYGLGNDWHLGADGKNKWNVRLGIHHIIPTELRFGK